MYSKHVELQFDGEVRDRAGAFRIKRSKTKRFKNKAESLLNTNRELNSDKLQQSTKNKDNHRSK
jgi:hypothetical protein